MIKVDLSGPNIQYLLMTQMIVIECYSRRSSLPVVNTSAVKCSCFECVWLMFGLFDLITWSQ